MPSEQTNQYHVSVASAGTSALTDALGSKTDLLDGCTRTWIGDDCHLFMMSVSGGKELSFASRVPSAPSPLLV